MVAHFLTWSQIFAMKSRFRRFRSRQHHCHLSQLVQ